VWIGAPLDGEVNAGIRARGESIASEGAQSLPERARAALAEQQAKLAGLAGDQAVFMPQTGWALSLGDFLTTRMMELVVHMDDLAVSVGLAAPEFPDAVLTPCSGCWPGSPSGGTASRRCCERWPGRSERQRQSTQSDPSLTEPFHPGVALRLCCIVVVRRRR
jgi:hypothetical protein